MRLVAEGEDGASTASDDNLVGRTLDGRYLIIDVIGQGGMGIVYEAEHVLIEKRVAVKVLRQDFTRKPDVVERFRQEARSASKIGHPNIIDVIDFGETPAGASYFVMEKLEGEDLAELLCRECVLAPARAVNIVYQCCQALSAAHKKGIFHRDLKPENLFLVRGQNGAEIVKVVDFGVAKMSDQPEEPTGPRRLTRTGMLFGTPEYMSPEQARGYPLDHRADIYSLGVILYELITGRVPFEGRNFMEVLSKHGSEPVPDLTRANPGTMVSTELQAVITQTLCKDRDARYATMDDMAEALAVVPEMPTGASEKPPPWALSVPTTPTEGMTRQRIAVQPLRQAGSDVVVSKGRPSSVFAPLRKRSKTSVALLGLTALVGLGWLWSWDGGGRPATRSSVGAVRAGTGSDPDVPRAPAAGSQSAGPVVEGPSSVSTTNLEADREDEVTATNRARAVSGELADRGRPPGASPAAATAAPGRTDVSSPADPETTPETVRLRVVTRPAGARVLRARDHGGCRSTPCFVHVPRGLSTVIKARHGSSRGSARVTARNDGQAVRLVLPSPRRRPAIPPPIQRDAIPPAQKAPRQPTAPANVAPPQDLKVPEAFR